MIDRPQFYDPEIIGSSYRDFQTRAEIEATGRGLDRVMALDQLFKNMDFPVPEVSGTRLLTYKNLLLSLWARASLRLPPVDDGTSSIAIPLSTFGEFYQTLWVTHEGHRIIGDAKKTQFLQWAADVSRLSSADLSNHLGMVFEALFDEIENELAPVEAGNLDPRHIHLFLLKP